ncbi:zinc-binding dehydrogenase [Streptomyces sp. NPDC052292]|uniref:zinc-binding dehydrogenase n=1 Tax=Streptomyces sp. NPDC052292 TaxID=3155053 RepID=UPI0034257359
MLESAQSTAPASNFKHLGREPPQSGARTSAAVPRLRRIPLPPAERQPDASTDRPPEGLGGRVDIRAGDRFTPGQRRSPAPRQGYAQLGRLLDAGTVRVGIDSTFPLADARAAHECAARGHIRGKIVLTVA